jgi:hypothetical protein
MNMAMFHLIRRAWMTPILLCLLAIASRGALAQERPPEVTTDSAAYCTKLYDRVQQLRLASPVPPSREAMDLTAEGQHMCDEGLARGGVMRLRRALHIMLHTPDEP